MAEILHGMEKEQISSKGRKGGNLGRSREKLDRSGEQCRDSPIQAGTEEAQTLAGHTTQPGSEHR